MSRIGQWQHGRGEYPQARAGRGAIRVTGATTIRNCSGVSMSVADFHVKVKVRRAGGVRDKCDSHRRVATPHREGRSAGALERRFQAVRIEEPCVDEAVAILLVTIYSAGDLRGKPMGRGVD